MLEEEIEAKAQGERKHVPRQKRTRQAADGKRIRVTWPAPNSVVENAEFHLSLDPPIIKPHIDQKMSKEMDLLMDDLKSRIKECLYV